jgi:C4-dicarboxylate-binding protein DctP
MSLSHHGYEAYVVVANRRFWDSLPPDIRAVLEQALSDATRYVESISAQEEADAIKAIRASGKCQIVELTDEEKSSLKAALEPVYRQMESRIGREVLESIEAASRSDPKQSDTTRALPAAVR